MKTFTLTRSKSSAESTIGELKLDGVHVCWTLEDVVRPKGVKVYGKTAIPAGKYELAYGWSPHFQKNMPHVLNVPGFGGVLLHAGNDSGDSLGCVLLGLEKGPDKIWNCAPAVQKVVDILLKFKDHEKIYLVIQ